VVAVPVVDQDRPCIHVSLASGSGQGQLTDIANHGGGSAHGLVGVRTGPEGSGILVKILPIWMASRERQHANRSTRFSGR